MVTWHWCFSYFCKCISFFLPQDSFVASKIQSSVSGVEIGSCCVQMRLWCGRSSFTWLKLALDKCTPCALDLLVCTGMVMMSGDWYGTLGWRVREKLLRTGKTSIWGLVLDCPSERVVYAGLHCTNSSLVAKPRAMSPRLAAAASQVAAWVCTGDFWSPSPLEVVALSSSPGLNFSEDFFTFRGSVMHDSTRELLNCYLATWCSPLLSLELPSSCWTSFFLLMCPGLGSQPLEKNCPFNEETVKYLCINACASPVILLKKHPLGH